MVFAHPLRWLATEAVSHILKETSAGVGPSKRLLSFDIYGPENI
jgi:hypothetical protein